jgi:small subunit ribosomal protein S1
LILSQKAAQRAAQKKRLAELEVGSVVTGRAVGLVDYGVFVDIGGIDGLVHISKLDRQHVQHPRDVVSVGDEMEVRIDDVDVDRGRISLNRKALQPDPWDTIDEFYHEDQLATGTVANVVDYGAFVALEHGFHGLIHVNEMDSFQVEDPHGFIEEGEEILVRIVEIDRQRQRINMSLDAVTTEERMKWMVEREEAAQAAADEEAEAVVDAEAEAEAVEAEATTDGESDVEAEADVVEADAETDVAAADDEVEPVDADTDTESEVEVVDVVEEDDEEAEVVDEELDEEVSPEAAAPVDG